MAARSGPSFGRVRTVACWQARAGAPCRRVREHLVQGGRVELGQVQADALRVRAAYGSSISTSTSSSGSVTLAVALLVDVLSSGPRFTELMRRKPPLGRLTFSAPIASPVQGFVGSW